MNLEPIKKQLTYRIQDFPDLLRDAIIEDHHDGGYRCDEYITDWGDGTIVISFTSYEWLNEQNKAEWSKLPKYLQ